MKLVVDSAQRYAKMRAHTAAHLLHASLASIFPDTKQAGSFVDEDYLRFDFAAERSLTTEELVIIQQQVNKHIYESLPVQVIETSYDEAVTFGAKAFFEDKYGDVVRVVKVDQSVSTELCGGTHVSNTHDIGCFAILSQEAVASGIKRIVAVTGPKIFEFIQEKDSILDTLAKKLGVNSKQVVDKAEKILKEYEDQQNGNKKLLKAYQKLQKENMKHKFSDAFEGVLKVPDFVDFKMYISLLADDILNQNIFVCNAQGSYAIISGNLKAKDIAKDLGLKGGGSDKIYQGKADQAKDIYNDTTDYIPEARVTTIGLTNLSNSSNLLSGYYGYSSKSI